MDQKLYVLVRKDLNKSQQAVQAGHAVAEYLLRGPSTFWGNGTLVYLAVRNEEELKAWTDKISAAGYEVTPFFEPDRGNEMTAFATECDNNVVRHLKLL
jgi:2-polyprenyl-3-methyl-5-hydroxy-6-metoxy-1,4-benzoquinol methylase